uniref:ADP-ribosylhydrolase ARH3 n=1 Tax=Alexandrium monilatum TaxID=311494 RepID=A0A7S4VKR0_9DINO
MASAQGAAEVCAAAGVDSIGRLLDEIDAVADGKLVAVRHTRENDLNGYSILRGVPVQWKEAVVRDALRVRGLDRAMGSMCGMAVGDALGHLFEFLPAQDVPGAVRFDLQTMKAHGASNAFCLQRGQWTDDAAMGLCMADSLILRRRFDGSDMRVRFWCWWNRGYNNAFRKDPSRSASVGLGGNIAQSLMAISHLPAGRAVPPTYDAANEDAGNGSLMRFAPVALFLHAADLGEAHHLARLSSYATHPGIIAAEACSLLCHIIVRALGLPPGDPVDARAFLERATAEYLEVSGLAGRSGWGYDQMKWLVTSSPVNDTERCWNWKRETLDIAGTLRARGSSYNGYPVSAGYFGSYSLDGLALALWSVYHTSSFDEAVVRSVNLLGDADSHGSITGQIAGALYGYSAIRPQFIKWLTKWDDHEFAVRALLLHHLGTSRTPEAMPDLPASRR